MILNVSRRVRLTALTATAALGVLINSAASVANAQTRVVDMVPANRSGETNTDSEPSLAIDPANYSRMAGSAFTWDNLTMAPMSTALAPIYVTIDRGATWTLAPIVPSSIGNGFPTGDINPDFSSLLSGAPLHETGWLYTGVLSSTAAARPMVVLRTPDYLDTATAMTPLDTQTGNVDQPHVAALSWFGQDKVFVGYNNNVGMFCPAGPGGHGRTATVDVTQSGAVAAPAFGITALSSRDGSCQDGFAQVPAAHLDGTVYMAFLHDLTGTARITVSRDDNFGSGATPFTALTDPSDMPTPLAGRFVTAAITPPSGTMGNTRLGASNISLAVDPRNSDRVYLAYGDSGGASTETIHVRRSINRGQDWSGDLLNVTGATNPQIAINSLGTVGVLYQRAVGTNWEAHLVRTTDAAATTFDTPGVEMANTPVIAGDPGLPGLQPQIGDYASLRAAGRNFFGMFSAANTPDSANFPVGVTYQRQVNWTTHKLYAEAAHTTEVRASIDPFFFEVDALTPDLDFYVRDWTDDATHGDNGAEPSTHPQFYTTSDVWNRRDPTPGPFVNDQPSNEDAGNGAGTVGDNFAFARVRRNAPGTALAVNAHFLVAKFGAGSNWVDGTVGDPDTTFPADATITTDAGIGPWVSPAFQWHLNAIAGNHLCLAVEISAPGSPFIPPSLVGQTVGWGAAPFTDLRILGDDHKAQRNMHLSTTPASGSPAGGAITDYAIIHNGDVFTRDIPIRIGASGISRRYVKTAGILAVGQEKRQEAVRLGGTLVLPAMRPGENRWVALSVETVGLPEGATALVTADELSGASVVNGFAVGVTARSPSAAVAAILDIYRGVAERFAVGFGAKASAVDIAISRTVTPLTFAKFVHVRMAPHLKADLLQVGGNAGDGFGLETLLAAVDSAPSDSALTDGVASLLNGVDARLTAIALRKGDPADIIQMVRWQRQLFRSRPELGKLGCAARVIEASDAFLSQREARKVTNGEAYPRHVEEVWACLREAVASKGVAPPPGPIARDLPALEFAHRDYLLALAE